MKDLGDESREKVLVNAGCVRVMQKRCLPGAKLKLEGEGVRRERGDGVVKGIGAIGCWNHKTVSRP